MPKTSVIIPIYNAQDTLKRCLDSLLAQTMTDFELLLINDGSQDGSAAICESYVAHDERIQVFHQANGGVSRARQKGLEQATGEYIIHVDADDRVSPLYLQLLYEEAVRTGADIILCDFEVLYPHKRIHRKAAPTSDKPEDLVYDLCTRLHGSCCNKLVRRAIIEEHGISFLEGVDMMEDKLFMIKCACVASTVSYVPEVLYSYDCTHLTQRTSDTNLVQQIYDELQHFVQLCPIQMKTHPKVQKALYAYYLTMTSGIVVNGKWNAPFLNQLGGIRDLPLLFSLRNLSLFHKLALTAKLTGQRWMIEVLLLIKRTFRR